MDARETCTRDMNEKAMIELNELILRGMREAGECKRKERRG